MMWRLLRMYLVLLAVGFGAAVKPALADDSVSESELDAVLAEVEALAGVVADTNSTEVVTNVLPSFDSIYEEMRGAVEEEVDQRWKTVKVGDYVELRRPDGIIPKGLVDEVVSNVVVVKNGEFVTPVVFSDLNDQLDGKKYHDRRGPR